MMTFITMTMWTAFRVLSRNRLRAGLTLLGIIIGVGAVIAMVSIGGGAREAVRKQVASMGTNVIMIWPGATTVGGVRGAAGGAVTLTISDALYDRLEASAQMHGLTSIEQLLEAWQAREDGLLRRQDVVRRIDALRKRLFATYGELPDSVALIREDRER